MKIADLDYYAIYGKSWLNRISARNKIITVFFIILSVVLIKNCTFFEILYSILLTIIIFSKLPRKVVLSLSLYPLIFIIFILLSTKNIQFDYALLLILKVLTASTTFSMLITTTSYVDIFSRLQRFLPSILVSTIFLTYRSIFILWKTVENLQFAMHIRGKMSVYKPIYSIKILSNSIGYLIIRAIESSESMYEAMKFRGYSNNLRYLRK